MTPVISPWVFYLMEISDNLIFICIFGALFVGFAGVAALLAGRSARISYGKDDEDYKTWHPVGKVCTTIGAICLIVSIFMPSQKTITKMIVAQNVTYERVGTVTDVVETVYEDIMRLLEDDDGGE